MLLKRDEQLRCAMEEFGRAGGGGVFKLHVVPKASRRASLSSLGSSSSPAASPVLAPAMVASAMCASVASLSAEKATRATETRPLPKQQQPQSTSAHPPTAVYAQTTTQQPNDAAPTVPKVDVLLIDDTLLADGLAAVLRRDCGFRVTIAADMEAAVQHFKQLRRLLRCVLVDMHLPGMESGQAVRRLRQVESFYAVGRGVPVFGLKGRGSVSNVRACEEAGMNGVISRLLSPGGQFVESVICAVEAAATSPGVFVDYSDGIIPTDTTHFASLRRNEPVMSISATLPPHPASSQPMRQSPPTPPLQPASSHPPAAASAQTDSAQQQQQPMLPPQPSPSHLPPAAPTAPAPRIHVLVLQEQPFISRELAAALQSDSFVVTIAWNSEAALHRFRDLRLFLRCVLMDMRLPATTRQDAMRRIRLMEAAAGVDAGRGVLIFGLSDRQGVRRSECAREAEASGMDGCITKLLPPWSMAEALSESLEAAAARPNTFIDHPSCKLLLLDIQATSPTVSQPPLPNPVHIASPRTNEPVLSIMSELAGPPPLPATPASASQPTHWTAQLATIPVAAAPTSAPTCNCYSETALLTLTAMVDTLTARVDSLSAQLQESERQRKEAERRNEERRAEKDAKQAEREVQKAKKRVDKDRLKEEERNERKAERETMKQMREEERKERETDRRQREVERKEREERRKERDEQRSQAHQQLLQQLQQPQQPHQQQQPQQQQQPGVGGQQAQGEGEPDTNDSFAAIGNRPLSPTLSAASAPSFASSAPSFASSQQSDSRRACVGDDSPSLSEEETDVVGPMLESARHLSQSSSGYFLCPPPTTPAPAAPAAPSSAGGAESRRDVMLARLEVEGYGVRSLNELVVGEHGGEEAEWDVVVRDLDLYYAQG